jgi:UDP-N-acetylglucosamine 2-epimerase (non-hydrolysing)
MACTITAKKMNILVAHVEGGIRSGDMNMPEEINRIVTDSISDYFFTTSSKANLNLIKTGVLQEKIFFVGNTMIDTLLKQRPNFIKPNIWDKNSLKSNQFIVLTLHRPSNVDNHDNLRNILKEIIIHSENVKIIFPLHPRTKIIFEELNIKSDKLIVIEPLPYLEFNYLVDRSKAVITDSGGITEETTVLGVPCMTLRDSTERPETVEMGTNELIGSDYRLIKPAFEKLNSGNWKTGIIPPLWDGSSSERIIDLILHIIKQK